MSTELLPSSESAGNKQTWLVTRGTYFKTLPVTIANFQKCFEMPPQFTYPSFPGHTHLTDKIPTVFE